ncbi:hypothetical protein VSH64_11845 [Amycolatopsis rhabdoformis]|uniref:Uncharacterized protein n=1 Tax=Amycolatopsis rhabdoformis TaxID=1448059 RepID=A0ABZ1IFH0_9PSEU|nr:hypothetical protein [Amycolatopsis rhabdoformis]WSE32796.1 hypothetical protein VSH64_11845 [Amycolatopsis rhabdoformis]
MKSVIWWSIAVLFGLGLVANGLFYTPSPDGKVVCGSEEMRPGDTCERTQYGVTSTETYDEKLRDSIDNAKSFNGGGRWVSVGIGTGIAGLAGWRLVVALRRRARLGSGPVNQGAAGHQAGFAPPPGFAPQDQFSAPGQVNPAQVNPAQFNPQQFNAAQSDPAAFTPPAPFDPQGQFPPQAAPVWQDSPQQPGFQPQAAYPQQQPGFPQQQGFPPPGYQPPSGPYQG